MKSFYSVKPKPSFVFQKADFDTRVAECKRVMDRYSNRIPIICEIGESAKNMLYLDKTKYLVPSNLTVGQFIFLIRKRLKLAAEQSIILYNEHNCIPPSTELVSYSYAKCKNPDGFLYFSVVCETTFG